MTRLTMAVTGDPTTFRPVTSSIIRKSKDGDVNVVILLFGTHYNISIAGILQQDSSGDIDGATQVIQTVAGNLEVTCKQAGTPITTANLVGTFSSFMFFYAGLRIKGHLKMSETSHGLPVPEFKGEYHFKDLLNDDELYFRLQLQEDELEFDVIEVVDGAETVIYNEVLGVGVDEKHFEFEFLTQGKSKLYTFTDYGDIVNQVRTRVWIGNLEAKLGECNVAIHNHNGEEVLKTVSSDFIFLEYPQIFLKFDREDIDRFIGQVKMYDDLNTGVETDWLQVRSRDYRFIGNRVIENGMIRVVFNTDNPDIEIWGWNFNADIPVWEKALTIEVETDDGNKSLKLQNITFLYFSKMQAKASINFGTSLYTVLMTRGDPYITLLNTEKLKFKIKTSKNRVGIHFNDADNGYSLPNTFTGGAPSTLAASGTVTCASAIAADTVTINGIVYTGVTGTKNDNTEFSVDTSDAACAADLADSIENDTRPGVTDPDHNMSGASVSDVMTVTDLIRGVNGNTITLASSDGGRLAVSGTTLSGGAATGGIATETLTGYTLNDNFIGLYNDSASNEVVGWISNIHNPTTILIEEIAGNLDITMTYGNKGNVFGVGILPSFPNNLVGGIPFPFIIGTQDEYIKWRANESILSFRELETYKKR